MNGQYMKIKKMLDEKLFQVLYPMIEELDPKLILIFFSDEFTSLEKMTDNPYSSSFQYPIYFAEHMIYIFDMFKNKKAGR
jgi:hypothetical protein